MSIANPYLYGHDPKNIKTSKMKKKAAIASIAMAAVLIISKFAAFLATGSVSLLSSLMDSSFDALASVVTLVSIIQAAIPADSDHRYGHGKLEAIGALCQAIFIFGSGIFLFIISVQRAFEPEPLREIGIGVGVMCLSILLTAVLITYQRHVIRKTKSLAISADNLHYQGDLVMNVSVLASIALSYYTGWTYFDPLFAVGVSFMLMRGAYKIGDEAFVVLLDRELSDEERAKIMQTAWKNPAVKGVHDLRTRQSGDRVFIEFHIEVDARMKIAAVHDVMDNIESMIYEAFPKSEVLIHPEPEGLAADHRIDDTINPA